MGRRGEGDHVSGLRELIDDFVGARETTFAQLFPSGAFPPSTLLIVRGLVRPELLVEIEAIAVTS
jgi:enamine deaminase RidA (YjgF/YER057c/UK114 family)